MSEINIQRAIQNIGGHTEPYTALVELIINSVESIEEAGQQNGCVTISILRNKQIQLIKVFPM